MPWDFWLIFLVLAVAIPWRGRARLQDLLARPVFGSKEKLALYGSTIAFQWVLLGIVLWRSLARGMRPEDLGVGKGFNANLLMWSVVGAAAFATFQWFNLRRLGRMTGPIPGLMRKLAERLLPQKPVESAPYAALAVTAGVCEEFVYRGFVMAALARMGLPSWGVLIVSSVLFGLAHAYQGKSGILGTTLMGLLFGFGRLLTGSIVPVAVWHAAVDLAAGAAGPRFLKAAPNAT